VRHPAQTNVPSRFSSLSSEENAGSVPPPRSMEFARGDSGDSGGGGGFESLEDENRTMFGRVAFGDGMTRAVLRVDMNTMHSVISEICERMMVALYGIEVKAESREQRAEMCSM